MLDDASTTYLRLLSRQEPRIGLSRGVSHRLGLYVLVVDVSIVTREHMRYT